MPFDILNSASIREEQARILSGIEVVNETAKKEDRDLSKDEDDFVNVELGKFDTLKLAIDRAEKYEETRRELMAANTNTASSVIGKVPDVVKEEKSEEKPFLPDLKNEKSKVLRKQSDGKRCWSVLSRAS